MCEFCTEHGEGKKWYEVMRNYSRELAAQEGRVKYSQEYMAGIEEAVCRDASRYDAFKKTNPTAYRFLYRMMVPRLKALHWGQIVPIEDVEKIVDVTDSITRFACACRLATTGREARYCFGVGFDWTGILGSYPDYSHGLEVLEKEEAKKLLRSFDQQGTVHSVWTFKTPFIGRICNCDMDCMAYRAMKTGLAQTFFRAEYVSQVDWDLCIGCKKCLSYCQYGAIYFSHATKKATIDMNKCYGCGVCRAVCSKDAITLRPRAEIPDLPW